MADVEPISGLLDQGCDLEADVLPTVTRTMSDLPRPLKRWDAPWLVREIRAAREQRLAGHPVEAPPPSQCAGCGSQWDNRQTAVGSFDPNKFGLYDMVGNVCSPIGPWRASGS
jgi:formylglycine-generating enzyme required for sulfatase activity